MINFHWLLNAGLSIEDKQTLVKQLEDNGYQSVLLAFNPGNTDPFVNATHLFPYAPKLDYMMAMRTYALSPRYCAMQCRAFKEVTGKEAILNLINGRTDSDQELFCDSSQPIDERRKNTNEFAKQVKQYSGAKIAFSGRSEQTILNVIEHGDMNFNLIEDIDDSLIDILQSNNKRIFGRVFVTLTDTVLDTEKLHAEYTSDTVGDDSEYQIKKRFDNNSLYGTPNEIAEKIIEFGSRGITDILLSAHNQEDINIINKTHEVIKIVRELGH